MGDGIAGGLGWPAMTRGWWMVNVDGPRCENLKRFLEVVVFNIDS